MLNQQRLLWPSGAGMWTEGSWALSLFPVHCPHLPPMSHAFPQKTALRLGLIYDLFFSWAARQAGSQCPDRGWDLCSLQWKCGVLTTGPPEKSLLGFILNLSTQMVFFNPLIFFVFHLWALWSGFSVSFCWLHWVCVAELGFSPVVAHGL